MVPSPVPDRAIQEALGAGADTDEVLRALAHPRRRHLLATFQESGESLSIEPLARRVVARECGCDDEDAATPVAEPVRISLYHVHVPALDTAGLVAFDPDERTVALTDLGQEVRQLTA